MYIYINIYIFIYIYTYKYICMYTPYIYYIRIYVYVCIFMYTFLYIYMYTFIHTYIYMYVNMYANVYIYIYIYMYTHMCTCLHVCIHPCPPLNSTMYFSSSRLMVCIASPTPMTNVEALKPLASARPFSFFKSLPPRIFQARRGRQISLTVVAQGLRHRVALVLCPCRRRQQEQMGWREECNARWVCFPPKTGKVTILEIHVYREREKFIIRQPPIRETDDYDSEYSWISDELPSSSRRWRRGDGRGESGERRGVQARSSLTSTSL